jgi:GDPmannose 4,6-dehydratase
MYLMLQQDNPKDYVLATGETYTVRDFVRKAFYAKGYEITWSGEGVNEIGTDQHGVVRVKVSEEYYRPCEVDLLLGDPSKAEKDLGWERECKTLDDLIVRMFDQDYE